MSNWAVYGFLLLALAIGFGLGRLSRNKRATEEEASHTFQTVESRYRQGLNYLLSDQPDAAVETFIESLEVTPATLETHLTFGNLMRKRGEVSRAIKIHQNLLSRPSLESQQALQVQLELSRDYMKLGLFDRAELLLRELSASAPANLRAQCLEHLIEIYQNEKEWEKGIEAISKLASGRFSRTPERWRVLQSHFYCELAEQALTAGDYLASRRLLRSASVADKQSVRASLLQADLEFRVGRYKDSVKALKQVFYQDPALFPEALPLLEKCYTQGERLPQLQVYLEGLLGQGASGSVMRLVARLIFKQQGAKAASEFLWANLLQEPSLVTLQQYMGFKEDLANEAPANKSLVDKEPGQLGEQQWSQLQFLLQTLQKQHAAAYRCHDCGFGGSHMHWLCPSCKTWNSIKPVD